MPESLIVVTLAGAVAFTWCWVVPRAWWAAFCRSDWFLPVELVQPAAMRPVDGVNVTRVIAVAVPGPAGTRTSTPTLHAIDQVRGDGARPFGSDPDAAALERRALEIIDQTWSETVWLTGCIDRARFDALCASLEYHRSQTVSAVELVVVRGLPAETPRTAR